MECSAPDAAEPPRRALVENLYGSRGSRHRGERTGVSASNAFARSSFWRTRPPNGVGPRWTAPERRWAVKGVLRSVGPCASCEDFASHTFVAPFGDPVAERRGECGVSAPPADRDRGRGRGRGERFPGTSPRRRIPPRPGTASAPMAMPRLTQASAGASLTAARAAPKPGYESAPVAWSRHRVSAVAPRHQSRAGRRRSPGGAVS
jgi:hypothetical protein